MDVEKEQLRIGLQKAVDIIIFLLHAEPKEGDHFDAETQSHFVYAKNELRDLENSLDDLPPQTFLMPVH